VLVEPDATPDDSSARAEVGGKVSGHEVRRQWGPHLYLLG